MAIIRVIKDKNYSIMCNEHLRELGMSLRAKGLMSVMLSLPDDWDFSVKGLEGVLGKEKEQAIQDTLNELKKFGYLTVRKLMPNETESGRIEYEYLLQEHKVISSDSEKTRGDFQPLELHPLTINKQITDNNKSINTIKAVNRTEKEVESATQPEACFSSEEELRIVHIRDSKTVEDPEKEIIADAVTEIDCNETPYPLADAAADGTGGSAEDFEEMFGTPIGTGREARLARTQNAVGTQARELFDYWNSKKLRVHKAFQSNYIERFTKIIQKYSIEEIKTFIDHYEKIVHDPNYYWTYIWDLQDFIDPRAERYLRFADGGQEWVNYNLGSKSQQEFRKSEFFSGDLEKVESGEKTIRQIDEEYKEKARKLRQDPKSVKF